MKTIVIFMAGGVITQVATDGEPMNVEVIDFDDFDATGNGAEADRIAEETREKYPLNIY